MEEALDLSFDILLMMMNRNIRNNTKKTEQTPQEVSAYIMTLLLLLSLLKLCLKYKTFHDNWHIVCVTA